MTDIKTDCGCAGCGYWLRLEAERHSRTYHKPEGIIVTRTVTRKVHNPERDKLMFNAGRYAAGARDKTAVAAHLKLESKLTK